MIGLILAQAAEAAEEVKTFVSQDINATGWFMLLFGVVVLYGGVALCLFRAMGAKVHKFTEADEDTTGLIDLNDERK